MSDTSFFSKALTQLHRVGGEKIHVQDFTKLKIAYPSAPSELENDLRLILYFSQGQLRCFFILLRYFESSHS